MRVEGEPERKGRGGKRSAVAFQQQVMDEMERYGRYPMTGPLALDLHFTAARRNPASIHHIAKHALDILGVVLPSNERPRRRGVLYRDDRQIKFLYVDLNQAWQPDGEEGGRTGSTFIIAQRARDVMADFCMAGRLDRERLYEDEESPFVVPDLPDEPEPDWLTAPGSALTATERFFAEETRFHDTRSLQDALLARASYLGPEHVPGSPAAKGRHARASGRDLGGVGGKKPEPAVVEPVDATVAGASACFR
jgi:hypothetical protein